MGRLRRQIRVEIGCRFSLEWAANKQVYEELWILFDDEDVTAGGVEMWRAGARVMKLTDWNSGVLRINYSTIVATP